MYKLLVKADKLNIRNTAFADPKYENWVGDLDRGSIFRATRLIKGVVYDGNDDWYADDGGTGSKFIAASQVLDVSAYQDWMLDLRLPEIWEYVTGKGVGVAVIDTGISLNNLDLVFDESIVGVYDKKNTLDSIEDTYGHGTKCSSILSARNKKGNYIGVAPECDLYIYKISEQNNFQESDGTFNQQTALRYIDAIDWCTAQDNIKVISISWSTALNDQSIIDRIQTSINNAHFQKKIVVAARGNLHAPPDSSTYYPACLQNVIAVGLISDNQYWFNYSGFIDIITHGIDISAYSFQNMNPIFVSGTSMSTAIVAGIICLILQKKGIQNDTNDMKKILSELSIRSVNNLFRLDGNLLSNFLKH